MIQMIAALLALFRATGSKMGPTSASRCQMCGTAREVIIGRHCTACIGKIKELAPCPIHGRIERT